MKLAIAVLVAIAPHLGEAATPAVCESYGAELSVMASVDQSLRSRWEYTDPSSQSAEPPRIVQQTGLVDRKNTERLKQLVRSCGWPKRSAYGKEAVNNAWLLAQHADHDRQFQATVVKHLERAVAAGEAPAGQLAYLSDRLSVASGSPQLYGTQLDVKPPCGAEFFSLDNRAKVEQRRKALGLPPLEEYRTQILQSAFPTNCTSP